MPVSFDPEKDAANLAKHGVSLARAADLDVRVLVPSGRDAYGGERTRAYGLLDGRFHMLVFTMRDGIRWACGAQRREFRRHVPD